MRPFSLALGAPPGYFDSQVMNVSRASVVNPRGWTEGRAGGRGRPACPSSRRLGQRGETKGSSCRQPCYRGWRCPRRTDNDDGRVGLNSETCRAAFEGAESVEDLLQYCRGVHRIGSVSGNDHCGLQTCGPELHATNYTFAASENPEPQSRVTDCFAGGCFPIPNGFFNGFAIAEKFCFSFFGLS